MVPEEPAAAAQMHAPLPPWKVKMRIPVCVKANTTSAASSDRDIGKNEYANMQKDGQHRPHNDAWLRRSEHDICVTVIEAVCNITMSRKFPHVDHASLVSMTLSCTPVISIPKSQL
jgi:hypothetical protein